MEQDNKKQIKAIQTFIREKKPAFLFGNGINRYNDPSSKSWQDLVLELLHSYVPEEKEQKVALEKVFETDFSKNITLPEMYDLVNGLFKEINDGTYECSNLQGYAKELIEENFWKKKANKHYKKILDCLKCLDVPLLTTNFDSVFEQYANLNAAKTLGKKVVGQGKYKSHFSYPWNRYYSNKELKTADDGFAIWHIHGTVLEPKSIHFGTNQYVGMIARAKSTIRNKMSPLKKSEKEWYGDNTWLDLFYNKNLVIIGLNLSPDESFLRWLMLGRNRHLTDFAKKEKDKRLHSLYLSTTANPVPYAQRVFLEICGFEIIELSSYQELYEDLWEGLLSK